MARSVIDPITRIEGHLRAEMEVNDGVVTDAWISVGCFRGMELIVKDRTPEDAAHIVQRICGVCPVSHAHSASIAAEDAYGIAIPNNARIIRNMIEGAQFLHSHILWFYNLAGLDYVNPLNALKADIADTYDLCQAIGTPTADFKTLQERLTRFAKNGQLSIFSGNWFGTGEYNMTPEADLILTSHYLEALEMQAKASEINALLGGKMPHVMTIVPGGTSFVPTAQKLDDLKALVDDVYNWVSTRMIPDSLALATFYPEAMTFGEGKTSYAAWGVFERPFDANTSMADRMVNRYLPAGIVDKNFKLHEVDGSKITEYVGHSWYEGDADGAPSEVGVHPNFTGYDVNDRYSWDKCPSYDGQPLECGGFSRLLVAYKRNVPFVVEHIDMLLEGMGAEKGDLHALENTLGRTAARQVETLYIATLMKEWVEELCEAIKSGDSSYFAAPKANDGFGEAFWEAPRGALYHSEEVKNGKIQDYQIIIPSTWNLAPRNKNGVRGPLEQALIGCPVDNIDMPINALRTIHSFDPCSACAVHIVEPKTGKKFETVTSPWGVK